MATLNISISDNCKNYEPVVRTLRRRPGPGFYKPAETKRDRDGGALRFPSQNAARALHSHPEATRPLQPLIAVKMVDLM